MNLGHNSRQIVTGEMEGSRDDRNKTLGFLRDREFLELLTGY